MSPAIAARSRRLRRGLGATLLVAALGFAPGCGGSGDGDAGGTTAAAEPQAQPVVIQQTAENGFDAIGVFRDASPGVVTIRSLFSEDGGLGSAAEGSGFVLNDEGEIITNAHVVTSGSGTNRAEADEVFVEFPDRNIVAAEIVGFDPFYDVALLKVDPDGLDLEPLGLGDDSELITGQPVATIGSPFGEQQSLSVGVISATDRSVRSLTQFQIEGAIQTDASINPGNSGGPLLDAGARVIGINQQIETQSGANDGVGFAVPVSAVKRSIEQLRESGEVSYAYIGVSSQALYPQLADKLGIDADFGGLIAEIVPGGPADDAGLRGTNGESLRFQTAQVDVGGDVILSVNGTDIVRPADLSTLIAAARPGEQITLEVIRDGERQEIEVTLEERPISPDAG